MDKKDLPESVEVLRRILFEGFGTGDTSVVEQLCSPDLVEHQFGLDDAGRRPSPTSRKPSARSMRLCRT